jgi:GDP-4-dehydro-6-deoxy-D-mannose reductase
MRILITGVAGFVGTHLAAHLRQHLPEAELHGVYLSAENSPLVTAHVLDLRDDAAVRELIARIRPDEIYHLAGQANVRRSFDAAWETLEHNLRPQLNLTRACIDVGIAPRMLIISSGEVYVPGGVNPEQPFDEDTPLAPCNPYGVSKVGQEMLALSYHRSHHLPILRARPFNHFGPGQRTGFVVPDFATQIARIEAGQQPPNITVGDLSAERDFTDVRDVVRAYLLIMARGVPGEVYNVASGRLVTIREVLDRLVSLARVPVTVQVDPAKFRPNSQPRTWGNCARLHALTGWQPLISLEDTLRAVLDECRARSAAG